MGSGILGKTEQAWDPDLDGSWGTEGWIWGLIWRRAGGSEFVLREEGLGSELGVKEASATGIRTLGFEDLERWSIDP